MYRLVQITGWSLAEIDAMPAALADWFLHFARIESEVEADAANKQRKALFDA